MALSTRPPMLVLINHSSPSSSLAPPTHMLDEDFPDDGAAEIRDIHPLTPPSQPSQVRRRDSWEGGSEGGFSTMSREFNTMVAVGSNVTQIDGGGGGGGPADDGQSQLARIGEDEQEETNPLAIVPDPNPLPAIPSPWRPQPAGGASAEDVPVHLVKREEVESKIAAWQTAETAKINSRFKREEVVISGWESERVEKATAWAKKVERKLDEQRARAMEKMQNDVAKARQKAAERRASAEARRGTKVAKVLELANFLRAVGRAPSKRSFF